MNKKTEKAFEWCLNTLPKALLKIAVAMIALVVMMQIGMSRGRELERADFEKTIAELNARADGMAQEMDEMQKEYLVLAIVLCESGGKHEGKVGDGGRAYGWTQIHQTTFIELAQKAGLQNRYWKNKDAQAAVLRWAVDNGYANKWSCYDKIKKTAKELGL
ncbi:MAG: hypothetical protein HY265_06325 [Deltaproteobacteria bacterium]|nr:hypothetical protein [Deltaproteobacteria bacterium]